jgi:hypothetical protein
VQEEEVEEGSQEVQEEGESEGEGQGRSVTRGRSALCASAIALVSMFAAASAAQANIFVGVQGFLNDDHQVWSTNLNGAFPDKDFIDGGELDLPQHIAVSGDHIYWVNYFSESIGIADINGANADGFAIDGPGVSPAFGIAVYGNHVYWSNDPTPSDAWAPDADGESIGRATLDANGQVVSGSVDPEWVEDTQETTGLAVHGNFLYWADNDFDEASITRAELTPSGDLAGSPIDEFVEITPDSNPNEPDDLLGVAVTDDYIFWADWRLGGSVGRVDLGEDGFPIEETFSPDYVSGVGLHRSLVTDGAYVYWGMFDVFSTGGAVGRMDLEADEVDTEFIGVGGGEESILYPTGVAVQRTTGAAVECGASPAGTPSTCLATVADTDISVKTPPAGSVALSTSSPGGLPTASCKLVPISDAAAACNFQRTIPAGGETLTAAYGGVEWHGSSSGSAPVKPGVGSGSVPSAPGRVDENKAAKFVKAMKKCRKKKKKKARKKCKKRAKKLLK